MDLYWLFRQIARFIWEVPQAHPQAFLAFAIACVLRIAVWGYYIIRERAHAGES